VDEKAYIPENEDEDDEYGAEGGGKANLASMAKSVDLKEMHAVLRVSVWVSTCFLSLTSPFPER
jgi:hypothetical protein